VFFVLFIVDLYICICESLPQNNNHKTKHQNNTNCGSAFEPGASGLPYYCTSICVRFGCTRRASCVDSKKKGMFFLHFWRHQRNNYFGARWTRAHSPVAFLHGSDVVHTIFTLEPFRSRFQTEIRNRSLSGMFCRISFIPNH